MPLAHKDYHQLTIPDGIDLSQTPVRVELDHVEPCWWCSKRLNNRNGTIKPPIVTYRLEIQGHVRNLHRTCAESLGFKILRRKTCPIL